MFKPWMLAFPVVSAAATSTAPVPTAACAVVLGRADQSRTAPNAAPRSTMPVAFEAFPMPYLPSAMRLACRMNSAGEKT